MFYVESYPLLDPRPDDSCHLISIQLNYWLRNLNPSTSADYNDMHKVTLWRRNLQQGIHKMGCNPNLERLHCFIVFNQSSIASVIAALTRRRSLYTGLKSLAGADPGFGQGGAPASEAESCRRSKAVARVKRAFCSRGPGPVYGPWKLLGF